MFTKGLFLVGLLAIFSCQEATANSLYAYELEKLSIGELINQIKTIVASLNQLVSGSVQDAIGTLTGAVNSVQEISNGIVNGAISNLTGVLGSISNNISAQVSHAIGIGVNVSHCAIGPLSNLDKLLPASIGNLTHVVSDIVNSSLQMVNNDLKVVNDIVSNSTNIPIQLTKCLATSRPVECLTNLLKDVSTLLSNLPGQITEIIGNTNGLVGGLKGQLQDIVGDVVNSTISSANGILANVTVCIKDAIANNATSDPNEKPTEEGNEGATDTKFFSFIH